jgi:aspartokinase/homoserine dehydrogenase 1
MDAARKALILARECGMALEFEDVEIEPILPDACLKAPSVDAFFAELEQADSTFEAKRAAAEARGKSLRYVAVVEEGKAKLCLREVAPNDPFRSLVDADNIVVVTTDRYSSLPLVVKGPGAGAQVTAGGVFADIVRIARTLV